MKALALYLGALQVCVAAVAAPAAYRAVNKLSFGGEGGWDALTVDSHARRLYVSRSTHVMVVNLDTGRLVGNVPDTPGVHGVALAPALNRGFTSNGRANTSTIFDLKTLKPLGHVKTGEGPDAIVYDPVSKCVLAFNGGSDNVTVFRAATGKVVATLALKARPEFAEADGHGKVYVNGESTSEVIEIDTRRMKVARRWSISPGQSPSGIAVDARDHRVFSACRNHLMTDLDVATGKVTTLPIGGMPDGAGYDAKTGLVFSSNGQGTVTVIGQVSPGKFAVVQTVNTQQGARTMAIDPKTGDLYLPTARFGPRPAPTAGGRRRWPRVIAGTFAILVLGRPA